MKKTFRNLLLLAMFGAVLTACDDKDNTPVDDPTEEEPVQTLNQVAYVLNQGSYYTNIEGSLSQINLDEEGSYQDIYSVANDNQSLGATPQCAVVYDGKIYIGVYESNVIHVVDALTCKEEKMISLASAEGQMPRSMVAKDGYVYISMYNGYVSRLDTETLEIDKTVAVGPNPEIMAIRGNYLYVPNSDGMNFAVSYGTTASKINLSSFTVEKTFSVGLNPCEFCSNGTDLFLLCKGDYYMMASKIYQIDDNDQSTELAEATLMAIKDKKLYYINNPFMATEIPYKVYDITSGTTKDMLTQDFVEYPAGIGVDPKEGRIVITSYTLNAETGYANYNTDGYANVYDSEGKLLKSANVGVSPVLVFFGEK